VSGKVFFAKIGGKIFLQDGAGWFMILFAKKKPLEPSPCQLIFPIIFSPGETAAVLLPGAGVLVC
jgi:hypothetical protein